MALFLFIFSSIGSFFPGIRKMTRPTGSKIGNEFRTSHGENLVESLQTEHGMLKDIYRRRGLILKFIDGMMLISVIRKLFGIEWIVG
jgi:hypothetical protein